MPEVFVGLGSNIRPVHHLRLGCAALGRLLERPVYSQVYAAAAEPEQGGYLNMVAGGHCELDCVALNAALKDIEQRSGRRRDSAEVTLDLDLLIYGGLVRDAAPRLPRDDVLDCAWVLQPLVEIAPGFHHPRSGCTLAEHWAQIAGAMQPLTVVGPLEGLAE